jgi:phospholipase/lecithinase/hemolysin
MFYQKLSNILSRKFFVFVSNFVSAFFLKYLGKINDETYLIIVLSVSLLYLFVEGALDLKNLSVKTNSFNFEAKEGKDVDSK